MKSDEEHVEVFESCVCFKFIGQTLVVIRGVVAVVSVVHHCVSAWQETLRLNKSWSSCTVDSGVSERCVELRLL